MIRQIIIVVIRGFRNRSPVAVGASENDPEILHLILQLGADCAGVDHRKWIALHLSAQHDNENTFEVITLLLESSVINLNAIEERGARALCLAVQARRAAAVQALLAAGSYPNAVTVSDVSVVERTVLGGDLMLIDLLLDAGTDSNRVDKRGLSVGYVTVTGENVNFVRRVLQTGIDTELKTTDNKELRPMQLAVHDDNEQIASLLHR